MLSRLALIYTLVVAGLLVGADQWTKSWGTSNLLVYSEERDTHLYQGSRRPILELGTPTDQDSGFFVSFQWNYVRNHGAAWGALSSLSESARQGVFQLGTLALCGLLLFLALQKRWAMPTLSRSAIVIIVAGALGNLLDRVQLGYVVDVFDLRMQLSSFRYALPAFNVADAMIVIGLIIATIAEFFSPRGAT